MSKGLRFFAYFLVVIIIKLIFIVYGPVHTTVNTFEILNKEQDITQISFDHTQIICSAESQ